MNDWKKFHETSLTEKEDFNCHLNLKCVTDADYMHVKRVCKDFKIDILGDLYVHSDKLLLVDVFNNFRNMCPGIYELDPANCFSAPGLAR